MGRTGSQFVDAPFPSAVALLAALFVLFPCRDANGQDAKAPAAPHTDQLVLTRGFEQEPMHEALDLFLSRLRRIGAENAAGSAERIQKVRPLPTPGDGTGSRGLGGHLGLAVYRALKESGITEGFALDFHDESGQLRLLGFDAARGVEATFAIKVENDQHPSNQDEHGDHDSEEDQDEEVTEQFRRAIDSMVAALEVEQKAADAADDPPYQETVRWLGDEDPLDVGFRWDYVRSASATLAQVTLVLDSSSLGQAGLRSGDQIIAIDGHPVASPPQFGRAIGSLRAGAPIAIDARRGGAALSFNGTVQRASEVVPAFEAREIGARLPPFRATIGGAPVAIGGAAATAATIVCLFDPRQPDTLRDAALLAWLRDHHPPEQVAIAGIAVHANDAPLKSVMDEIACGWPAVADPDGRLAEATRTITLPALLLADRDGVVRFRQARSGNLQHALRSVLAAKR